MNATDTTGAPGALATRTLDCGHTVADDMSRAPGTGYVTNYRTRTTMCYPCGWHRDRVRLDMLEPGAEPIGAYVSADGHTLVTWTGGHLAKVISSRASRNSRGTTWHYVFARGARTYYGSNAGPGHSIAVRRHARMPRYVAQFMRPPLNMRKRPVAPSPATRIKAPTIEAVAERAGVDSAQAWCAAADIVHTNSLDALAALWRIAFSVAGRPKQWWILRDGRTLEGPFPDENAAHRRLARMQYASSHWAMKYEGYDIVARPATTTADKEN